MNVNRRIQLTAMLLIGIGTLQAERIIVRKQIEMLPFIKRVAPAVGPAPVIMIDPITQKTPSRTLRRLLPSTGPSAPSVAGMDKLKLLIGDQITGSFIGYKAETGLQWRHPSISQALTLTGNSLARLTLSDRPTPVSASRHTCRVVMVNNDELLGDLVELRPAGERGQILVLNTWYAGRLEIPIEMVRSISPGVTGSRVVYVGPDSANGWATGNSNSGDLEVKVGQNANPFNGPVPVNPAVAIARIAGQAPAALTSGWRYSKGAFHSLGSGAMIGRNFDLPDKTLIEFDLHCTGYFSIGVNLYTDRFNQYSGNSYQLRLDRSNAYLYRTSPTRGSQNMGNNGRTNLGTSKTKARVSIFVDKKKREISLQIDGRLVKTWRDNVGKEFNGKGNGIMFVTRNSTPIRVSDIEISAWDGKLPMAKAAVASDGKEDLVEFLNKDILSGKVLSLKRGRLAIDAGFDDPVEIALERIGRIDLKSRGGTVPAMSVRAVLRNRGQLSFTLENWANGKVHLNSPIFGKVTVDDSIFSTIDFNIGQPRNEND